MVMNVREHWKEMLSLSRMRTYFVHASGCTKNISNHFLVKSVNLLLCDKRKKIGVLIMCGTGSEH